MPQVVVRNPRLTATAEIEIGVGVQVSVTFERDANELDILQRIKAEITAKSQAAAIAGEPEIHVPTDEELVPVLAALNRMKDVTRDIAV